MTRRPLRRFVSLAAALSALLFTVATRATPTSRLVYSRTAEADSCPDEQALRRAVASRVGYDPFFPYATRTIVVSVTRRDRAFVASVDLVDEGGLSHGARELRAEGNCTELLDAAALAIAIAIDPQSLTRTTAPAPPPPAEAPVVAPPPDLPPPQLPTPAPEPVRTTPPPGTTPASPATPEVSLGPVVSAGISPGPLAFGFAVGGALRLRSLSLGLEGRIDAPGSKSVAREGTVSSWLLVASLVPCLHLGIWSGCAVAQGGSMQAAGPGVPGTHSESTPWWAAGGRLGVELPIGGGLRIRFHGDLLGDLSPVTLHLADGLTWTAPPLAGSVGADLVFHFR